MAATAIAGTRSKKLNKLKSNARYYKPSGLFQDANNFSVDPTVHTQGAQFLIGNKNLIMRDLLNRKLDNSYKKTMTKTGSPIESVPQTYFVNETELTYDPKTMAEGTYAQQVQEQLTVKHVAV